MNKKVFWAYEEGSPGRPDVLRLEGPIAEESWWGDEVTPADFRRELERHPGDLVVAINSPGGDVIAGSMIYSMLKEHQGQITVRIEGLAASAASVVAMAGDIVQMAPTAYMMIHNAWTAEIGDNRAMRATADKLDEIDRGIRCAYQTKTGKSEKEIGKMMDAETWMSAPKALEEHFCDVILYQEEAVMPDSTQEAANSARERFMGDLPGHPHLLPRTHAMPAVAYSARDSSFLAKMQTAYPTHDPDANAQARARLNLMTLI